MERIEAHRQLVLLLATDSSETSTLALRLPKNLLDAAAVAVGELGVSTTVSSLTADALRSMLDQLAYLIGISMYEETNTVARASVSQLASVLAILNQTEFAGRDDLIEAAAEEVLGRHPDARPEDVLLWLEAQQAASNGALSEASLDPAVTPPTERS